MTAMQKRIPRPVPETAELLRDTALVLLGLAALVILVLTVLYLLLAGFWPSLPRGCAAGTGGNAVSLAFAAAVGMGH